MINKCAPVLVDNAPPRRVFFWGVGSTPVSGVYFFALQQVETGLPYQGGVRQNFGGRYLRPLVW
jgi:hypothetical protein